MNAELHALSCGIKVKRKNKETGKGTRPNTNQKRKIECNRKNKKKY